MNELPAHPTETPRELKKRLVSCFADRLPLARPHHVATSDRIIETTFLSIARGSSPSETMRRYPRLDPDTFFDHMRSLDARSAETLNATTFQTFLEQLLVHHERICLIIDNVKFHTAKKLKPFFQANRNRPWLYKLPKRSPEINATEMAWREARKDATHNRYFPTTKRLTRSVQTQFRIYQKEPHRIAGCVAQFLRA